MVREFNSRKITQVLIFLIGVTFFGSVAVAEKASSVDNIDIRFLHVQPGQTLHNIVKRIYAHRKSEWKKITRDIVRMNPHAFVNNDATKMKADVRLELPRRIVKKRAAKLADIKSVGRVEVSDGLVYSINLNHKSRKLHVGDSVFIGDKLITGADGFLRLHMIDDAILDLRCSSIMVIEQYSLTPPDDKNQSVLNLLEGSLKKITGTIGKFKEDVYQLKTPVANIGIRGTEYALRVFQSKGCAGKDDVDEGLYLDVTRGAVDVDNKAGSTVVAKGDTLYIPLPDAAPEDKVIKPGVLEAKKEEPVKDEGVSYWWYLLGLILLGFAL